MKRKEQEARIEQQRQEKEKAREDAARERARYFICYRDFDADEHFVVSGYSDQVLKSFAVMWFSKERVTNTEM